MSINLLSSGVIPLNVESVSTSSLNVSGASALATLNVSGASSLMGTSFNNQAVSGVLSLSGGDAGGLLVSSTTQNLNLSASNGAVLLVQSANRSGTVTANNTASVNVATNAVTANSIILLTVKTASGTNGGSAYVNATMVATGFSITNAGVDHSVYSWIILN